MASGPEAAFTEWLPAAKGDPGRMVNDPSMAVLKASMPPFEVATMPRLPAGPASVVAYRNVQPRTRSTAGSSQP